eukprot:1379950-Heterocapsa_arctica.AAC.1
MGDAPPIIQNIFLGPREAPKGANTGGTLAKGQICVPLTDDPLFCRLACTVCPRASGPINLSLSQIPGFLGGPLKSYLNKNIIFPGIQES